MNSSTDSRSILVYDSANEAAREAHYWLARAKNSLDLKRADLARECIANARKCWDSFLFLIMPSRYRVAARRTTAAKGAPRWLQVIHVAAASGYDELALCFTLKTYAHRQSADRAAKKATATLFA